MGAGSAERAIGVVSAGGGAGGGIAVDGGGGGAVAVAEDASASGGLADERAAIARAAMVGIGLGSFFGLKAMGTLSDADKHCSGNACDQQGLDLRSDSRSQAVISTVGFAVGGVALAGAAVLWFTAPRKSAAVGFAPALSHESAGIVAVGRF